MAQDAHREIEYTPPTCVSSQSSGDGSRPPTHGGARRSVALPLGPIGVIFSGSPPKISEVNHGSPVGDQLRVGQYPVGLNTRALQLAGFPDATSVDTYLFRYEEFHRTLVVSDEPPVMQQSDLPQKLTFRVMIPPSRLRVRFAGSPGHDSPVVKIIRDNSPIRNFIEEGLILQSIMVPGEGELSTLSMETADVLATLARTRQNSSRVLVFQKEEPALASPVSRNTTSNKPPPREIVYLPSIVRRALTYPEERDGENATEPAVLSDEEDRGRGELGVSDEGLSPPSHATVSDDQPMQSSHQVAQTRLPRGSSVRAVPVTRPSLVQDLPLAAAVPLIDAVSAENGPG
jgi:hypothetical protein